MQSPANARAAPLLARVIKAKTYARGLTLCSVADAVAARLGCHRSSVYRVINCRRNNPDVLAAIARELGTTPAELMELRNAS